jgi:hypothetical protein
LAAKSIFESLNETRSRLGIKPADRVLVARLRTATLQFYLHGELVKSYVISTSRLPASNVKNSLGTPRGLHEIAERIGSGQPAGMVFDSRMPTGRHFSEIPDVRPESNLVATRILWLRGLEPGVNLGGDVDTHERYIYIHGTNREERIGQPVSAGCLLMRNLDIIELYDEVRVGDQVLIVD